MEDFLRHPLCDSLGLADRAALGLDAVEVDIAAAEHRSPPDGFGELELNALDFLIFEDAFSFF